MNTTIIPLEYVKRLKEEFKLYARGLEADEDRGYFIEWLMARLFALEKQNFPPHGN